MNRRSVPIYNRKCIENREPKHVENNNGLGIGCSLQDLSIGVLTGCLCYLCMTGIDHPVIRQAKHQEGGYQDKGYKHVAEFAQCSVNCKLPEFYQERLCNEHQDPKRHEHKSLFLERDVVVQVVCNFVSELSACGY